jgi:dihydroflavonol-4-reductase
MKALVTGASGFVGSTLVDYLNLMGVEVRCLLRKSSSREHLARAKFSTVEGDLFHTEALEQAVADVDWIFHVAGVVAAKSKDDFFRSNVLGTKNLLNAAAEANARAGQGAVESGTTKLKKFVLVSSLAAAGPSRPDRPRSEEDLCDPVSWYGESKRAAELEALDFQRHLPLVIVRPPAVYGPRDRGVFTFFQTVNRGVLPQLGLASPDPRRYSFIHVEDLVAGIVKAAEAPTNPGAIYYLSGDEEVSWVQAMQLVAEGLGKKTWKVPLPIPVMTGAAGVCTLVGKLSGKALPFSLDKMKEIAAPAWTCSNRKAKKDLGFVPNWPLDRGLRMTAEWYRQNGWL